MKAAMVKGTLHQNSEPHQNLAKSTPAISGETTAAAEPIPAHAPMAERSLSSSV